MPAQLRNEFLREFQSCNLLFSKVFVELRRQLFGRTFLHDLSDVPIQANRPKAVQITDFGQGHIDGKPFLIRREAVRQRPMKNEARITRGPLEHMQCASLRADDRQLRAFHFDLDFAHALGRDFDTPWC